MADCWNLSEFLGVHIRVSPVGFPYWQGCLQTAAGRGLVHSMGLFRISRGTDMSVYCQDVVSAGPLEDCDFQEGTRAQAPFRMFRSTWEGLL